MYCALYLQCKYYTHTHTLTHNAEHVYTNVYYNRDHDKNSDPKCMQTSIGSQ